MKTSFWQKIALVLLGVLLTAVILEIGLRVGGFILITAQECRNWGPLHRKGSYRILCLGESTTQGEYAHFLEEVLNKRAIGVKFSVIDKGLFATNTWIIVSRLASNIQEYHPDMVITMMGVNDAEPNAAPYEPVSGVPDVQIRESLRVLKLCKLLWLRSVHKSKELGFHPLLQKIGLPEGAEERYSSLSEKPFRFKETKEPNPVNPGAYIELGKFYQGQGRFLEAEASFKKAIELNPRSDGGYVVLGWLYRDQGRSSEVEELLKKAIAYNPANARVYAELGTLYRCQGRIPEAEELFKKAVAVDPRNSGEFVTLGKFYQGQGKSRDAEASFKQAIAIDSKNTWAHLGLGRLCLNQGRISEAQESFMNAVDANPKNYWAYVSLGWLYLRQDRFSEAEELFKKAVELNPAEHRMYGALEMLYDAMGNRERARECGKKVKELRSSAYSLQTISNYQKLAATLRAKGIVYACMQYPMRDIEPLKKIFQGTDKGIIFIDNEEVFKEAVAKEGYKAYFRDMFGGDFGHCTEKGNRLLAENIANAILKEIFHK